MRQKPFTYSYHCHYNSHYYYYYYYYYIIIIITGNQKIMGSIPVSNSEVFSSEKKKLVSTETFLL